MKLFVDSDVILDHLSERDPFRKDAARLFSLLENQKVTGFTSPLVFANLHYILRKTNTKEEAIIHLRKLRLILGILPLTQEMIDRSLRSEFSDFEDSIQHEAALAGRINFIITRNEKDYRKSRVVVFSPREFVSFWRATSR
jgi:predicted nucleic acid-binding protein